MSGTRESWSPLSVLLGMVVVCCLARPSTVLAQGTQVDLVAVEQRMAEGRFEAARSVLQEWLETVQPSASWNDRQHGIWLRALLTVDPQMAERDLRRLVVEFPGGLFSDHALLRLARGAQARSDGSRALRYLDTLLSYYPLSPLLVEARLLSDEVAGVGQNP